MLAYTSYYGDLMSALPDTATPVAAPSKKPRRDTPLPLEAMSISPAEDETRALTRSSEHVPID